MDGSWDRNLKIYIWNGILYSIMLNLYSPFAVKFLERLGGNELHISLFNALPGLVAVFATLPGMLLVLRFPQKKKVTALFFLLSRVFLLFLAFVPWMPRNWQPFVFVLLFSLRNFPDSVSQSALQSFSGDLFSPEARSTAIALRNRFSIPATLVVTFAAGKILSDLASSASSILHTYQVFFLLAFLIGVAEIIVFLLFKEPPASGVSSSPQILGSIRTVLKDRNFRSFAQTSLIFYFTWQMGWPLFNIYQIITLGADEWWLSLIAIFSSIGMFTGYKFWNEMIRRKGNRFVMWATTLGMALNPLIMLLSNKLYVFTALNLILGFFTAGTVTVLLSYLLEVTPDENRVVYIGVYNTLVNISLAVSPFAAHLVLRQSNIYIAIIIVAALRFTSSMIFFFSNRKAGTVGIKA